MRRNDYPKVADRPVDVGLKTLQVVERSRFSNLTALSHDRLPSHRDRTAQSRRRALRVGVGSQSSVPSVDPEDIDALIRRGRRMPAVAMNHLMKTAVFMDNRKHP